MTKKKNHQQVVSTKANDLMALPSKKALEIILDSLTPAYVIQGLAEEDFFLFIHDIGEEDALPILARASNEQWQFILDVELWEKDRLADDAMGRWLTRFMKAAPERCVTWTLTEHPDLMSLHLLRNISVRILEQDQSPSELGKGYFSLDNVFYIKILDDAYSDTIRDFLERLAALDVNAYHSVLSHLGGIFPASAEEELFRMRSLRMAEKGFLPFDEAIGIYHHLSPEHLLEKGHLPDTSKIEDEGLGKQVVPVSKSFFLDDHGPFYMALHHITDGETLERLQLEFSAMCNQIMSADHGIARKKEELAAVVRKACGYLDIGIERMERETPGDMARLVAQFPLSQIFRVGYGVALELKWRAQKWFGQSWFKDRGLDFDFWEDWRGGILLGLLQTRPLFYTEVSTEGEPYREFRHLKEVHDADQVLDQVIAIDGLFSRLFAHVTELERLETYHPVTYKNLLFTAWLRHAMDLEGDLAPVTAQELLSFFPTLWTESKTHGAIKKTVRKDFLDWMMHKTEGAAHEISAREVNLAGMLLDELEKEYGTIAAKDLDVRYMSHVLITPG